MLTGKPVLTKCGMGDMNKVLPLHPIKRCRYLYGPEFWAAVFLVVVISPGPGITEPERGQHMQRRRAWTAIGSSDADEDILRIDFGILDRDIEVAVLCKGACVDQFIFRFASSATSILRR